MPQRAESVEWATVGIGACVYGSWLAIVAGASITPSAVTIVLLSVVIAWHGSLQHEALHGHPFTSERANSLFARFPLGLRLPYSIYRRDHLRHHAAELTDPDHDTESFYVSASRWQEFGIVRRWFALLHHTLLGRFVFGPAVVTYQFFRGQVSEGLARQGIGYRRWIWHGLEVAALLVIVVVAFGVPWWVYGAAVYISHGISLVRSYLEHRWVEHGSRCATVRAGRTMSLLFLNNNLHEAHHTMPHVAWYALPAVADELGCDDASAAGAGLYSGYLEVFARFAVRPFDHPLHPADRPPS